MNERVLMSVKAGITAALTALGAALGWQGVMAAVWIAAMGLDYLSGSLAACKAGEWSSGVARQGLWHKGGMILVVLVAALADYAMGLIGQHIQPSFAWPGAVLPLVLAWYILTELGSILENAIKMGANAPKWLVRLLKISLAKLDAAGENATGEGKDHE